MKINWKSHHKWSSLCVALFLCLFCVSGIVLNHRDATAFVEVPGQLLPPFYRNHSYNNGLLRGSLQIGPDSVLLYGNAGVWLVDSAGSYRSSFNNGLPESRHFRNVRAILKMKEGTLFLLTTTGLYRHIPGCWKSVDLPSEAGPFSDMISRGDSIVIMTRSELYVARKPWVSFSRIVLPAPKGTALSVSAFQKVWKFHSGELFGLPGIIFADCIAMIIIFLCLTGIMLWLFPKALRRHRNSKAKQKDLIVLMRKTFRLHKKTGLITALFTISACFTGWLLRPPALIALAKLETERTVSCSNPWQGRLRMIRFDGTSGRWLISTSDGFFETASLTSSPERIKLQPPVSIMGLNLWQTTEDGHWLCGSFSGLFDWDISAGKITDCVTGKPAVLKPGPPFGKTAVAGIVNLPNRNPVIVDYSKGCSLVQPVELEALPMPLWNFALETHTGRIFFGKSATFFYVFIFGGLAIWSLVSGLMLAISHRSSKTKLNW